MDGLFLIRSVIFLVDGTMGDFFNWNLDIWGSMGLCILLTPSILASFLWYHSIRGRGRRCHDCQVGENPVPHHTSRDTWARASRFLLGRGVFWCSTDNFLSGYCFLLTHPVVGRGGTADSSCGFHSHGMEVAGFIAPQQESKSWLSTPQPFVASPSVGAGCLDTAWQGWTSRLSTSLSWQVGPQLVISV